MARARAAGPNAGNARARTRARREVGLRAQVALPVGGDPRIRVHRQVVGVDRHAHARPLTADLSGRVLGLADDRRALDNRQLPVHGQHHAAAQRQRGAVGRGDRTVVRRLVGLHDEVLEDVQVAVDDAGIEETRRADTGGAAGAVASAGRRGRKARVRRAVGIVDRDPSAAPAAAAVRAGAARGRQHARTRQHARGDPDRSARSAAALEARTAQSVGGDLAVVGQPTRDDHANRPAAVAAQIIRVIRTATRAQVARLRRRTVRHPAG